MAKIPIDFSEIDFTKSNHFSYSFKVALRNSWLTYEQLAEKIGVNGKQRVCYMLNSVTDDKWSFSDLAIWCSALNLDVFMLCDLVSENLYREQHPEKFRNYEE